MSLWSPYSGAGWKLVAAMQWGADPTDPRLQAASKALIGIAPGEGGFSRTVAGHPIPWLTARLLQALAELGWCRHPRFQEALAWLDEGATEHDAGGWRVVGRGSGSGECAVTAVALLGALTTCGDRRRPALRERAVASLTRTLGVGGRVPARLGHPNLGRTDDAEILATLARASVPLADDMDRSLRGLQWRQIDGGRWRRETAVPTSLPVALKSSGVGPSRWVTLKCVVALLSYAVEAGLPRMYPQKPVSMKSKE